MNALAEKCSLSLLVPYRNRPENLRCLVEWFKITSRLTNRIELIIIEGDKLPSVHQELPRNAKYIFQQQDGAFNKAKLLNGALRASSGMMIVPFDVDLVPVDLSFKFHLELAINHLDLLVSGYRINYPESYLKAEDIARAKFLSEIAEEDVSVTFLEKQLKHGQRFGVLPFFRRAKLLAVGAWDERFEGWGGEDQDLIERYLKYSKTYLFRSHDILYIHLSHSKADGWNEERFTMRNRLLYQQNREAMGSHNEGHLP